ncbi:hypothetical protein ACVBEF_16405, partial [Glaciimonas sp. GG7]
IRIDRTIFPGYRGCSSRSIRSGIKSNGAAGGRTMKQIVQRVVQAIDAKSLRERIAIFAGIVSILILVINAFVFDAQFDEQKELTEKTQMRQTKIAQMQTEIQTIVGAQAFNPDAANTLRLQNLQTKSQELRADLQGLSSVLVKPENMAALLEQILIRNNGLHLVSLKTLPVSSLGQSTDIAPKVSPQQIMKSASVPSAPTPDMSHSAIYKHGVEMVIRGKYPDMLAYMTALEAMPSHLYWGRVTMQVDTYPETTWTLSVFTLSLDQKWLNL